VLKPSLLWALDRILPGLEETLLLRTLLHRGPSAREAWECFRRRIEDLPALFRTDTGGRNRLSPLLLTSLRENDLEADPGLLTVLRTAYLREELRAKAYRDIVGSVVGALQAADVRFLVLKGAALSETVYAEPCLRHSHDIDLILPSDEVERAGHALQELGLRREPPLEWDQGIAYRHRTDTPVQLLTWLFRFRVYPTDFQALWPNRRLVEESRVGTFKTLNPTFHLLHALGHASYCPSRSTLLWATDAWMLLHAREGLEWGTFVERTVETRLELPVFLQLRYLKEELQAPIPEEELAELGAVAEEAGVFQRDLALFGARQTRGGHPNLTRQRRPSVGARVSLLLRQVFPSREYIGWAFHDPHPAMLPFIYLARPFSYLGERVKWRLLRIINPGRSTSTRT
jgi:hypothetical protein